MKIRRDMTELLSVVVTLSMAATPLILLADDRYGKPAAAPQRAYDAPIFALLTNAGDMSRNLVVGHGTP